MGDISKRGGRKYPSIRIGMTNWFEQSQALRSVGRVISVTLFRTIYVGYRNRTVVVNQR